jgi:HIV Tat-specific factor 1
MCTGEVIQSPTWIPFDILQKMNGRFFAGRKVSANYLNGKPQFKKTGREEAEEELEEGDEKQRLDEFAKWLQGGDKPGSSGTSER